MAIVPMLSARHYLRQKQQPKRLPKQAKENDIPDDRLSRPINRNSAAGVAYLEKIQNTYQDSTNRSDGEANTTDRDLSNQLRLITTVFITANIVVFGNKDLLNSLTYAQKGLSLCGLVCLGISLYLGIAYIQKVKEFHKTWAAAKNRIANAIADREVESFYEIEAKVTDEVGHLNANIDEKLLKQQIELLATALLFYLVLVVSLLFDFHSITGGWGWYK
jgi:hypothetical protein